MAGVDLLSTGAWQAQHELVVLLKQMIQSMIELRAGGFVLFVKEHLIFLIFIFLLATKM
jgi:hypothetical protein